MFTLAHSLSRPDIRSRGSCTSTHLSASSLNLQKLSVSVQTFYCFTEKTDKDSMKHKPKLYKSSRTRAPRCYISNGTCLIVVKKRREGILWGIYYFVEYQEPHLEEWTGRAESSDLLREPVRIALKLVVDGIPASNLESTTAKENSEAYKAAWKLLKGADEILVPGGFGDRGVLGKIILQLNMPAKIRFHSLAFVLECRLLS
ncbi:hypothetical protein VNO78_11774 [Psophocarpus tetragonolobus]|uniref:Uncharacterized protein n=1 Tax=Psophocarpus tetragonolobus TaxID=3891 RepID=A0AAN9SUG7_PSOTE